MYGFTKSITSELVMSLVKIDGLISGKTTYNVPMRFWIAWIFACHGMDPSTGGSWSGTIDDIPPLSFVLPAGYGYVARMIEISEMCGRHRIR